MIIYRMRYAPSDTKTQEDEMIRISNGKCRINVQQTEEFKANNLSGQNVGDFYVVYSYGWWPLFAYNRRTMQWFENEDRYSVSTSKQRGQAHPYGQTIEISYEALKAWIAGEMAGEEVA